MMTGEEVLKAIHDDAWAAISVTTMRVEGIDELLGDQNSHDALEAGITFGAGATLAYLRDRGWINLERMGAEVSDG